MSDLPPKAPRRRFVPRFSLAAALFAMTLCAIGLWYWYRVPFEVEHRGLALPEFDEYRLEPYGPGTPPFMALLRTRTVVRKTISVRRDWNGRHILHGARFSFDEHGKTIGEDHWRDGVPHGVWVRWFSDGQVREAGEYFMGRKHGEWKACRQDDSMLGSKLRYFTVISSWQHGLPHGTWKFFDSRNRVTHEVEFQDGKLVGTNPLPVTERMHVELLRPASASARYYEGLLQPTTFEAKDAPLKQAIEQLRQSWDSSSQGPMTQSIRDATYAEGDWTLSVTSPKSRASTKLADLSVTTQIDNLPAMIALIDMLAQHGLVVDCRHGRPWITTPAAARQWRDTTGMNEIPFQPGSALAEQMDVVQRWEMVNTPLIDALKLLGENNSIVVDTSALPPASSRPRMDVTANLNGLTLKDGIAILLEKTECRARLDGATFVIEYQPGHAPAKR